MSKLSMLAVPIAIILVFAAAHAQSAPQSTELNHFSATLHVLPVASNEYELNVEFESAAGSEYPAGCLSAYRDLQFALKNDFGEIIPVSHRALENPPFEGKSVSVRRDQMNRPEDCAKNGQNRSGGFVLLSVLYPNLAPGTYTLGIEFAPRRLGERRAFAPVKITIR